MTTGAGWNDLHVSRYTDEESPNDAIYDRRGPRIFLNMARPERAREALRALVLHHRHGHPGDLALAQDGVDVCDALSQTHQQAG